ncbi:MAG: hypothetical protein IT223_04320 [Crocinitomicaceae bacterium]|nr:hypothetical protein [Crocinitomicaceae bacterium]
MKNIICVLSILLSGYTSFAQSSDTTSVGKIVYYEGKVELGAGGKWIPAKINAPVRRNQTIRIPGDGMSEITWTNGSKSIVGPNSNIPIDGLFSKSNNRAKAETEGVFNDFKTMFTSNSKSSRSQEGGIRRTQAEAREKEEPGQLYWKEDREITFDEAFAFYENGDYGKAIAALHSFTSQKPDDELAKYAYFAEGHCYIIMNNPLKAKEIFERFIMKYPNDTLKSYAEKVTANL